MDTYFIWNCHKLCVRNSLLSWLARHIQYPRTAHGLRKGNEQPTYMRQGVWHTSPFYQMKTLASISIIISIIIHHRQLAATLPVKLNHVPTCCSNYRKCPKLPLAPTDFGTRCGDAAITRFGACFARYTYLQSSSLRSGDDRALTILDRWLAKWQLPRD